MNLLQQPGHVLGHGAHGLHTLHVERSLSGLASVGYVPVLRGDYGHIHHLESHVHGLESSRRTAPSAHAHGSGRLILSKLSGREEHPLNERQHRAVGLSVVDRRADNQRIALLQLLCDAVADIVVEHATLQLLHGTLPAGNATTHGLHPDMDNLCFQTVLFECLCSLAQRHKRVAVLARTAVDK